MNPQRVAIFLPSLAGGGAERAMVNLANAMSRLGYETELVLGRAEGPYLSEVSREIRVADLGHSRVSRAVVALARYLRERRPCGLISAMDHANVCCIGARAMARVPTRLVVSIRQHLTSALSLRSDPRLRWVLAIARRVYRRADGIVAVSQDVAEDAIALLRLDPERVHVVPNPSITPDLASKRGEAVCHSWFGPEPAEVVLACGRLVAEKDFGTLLRAFAKVRAQYPARLVVLGEGPQRSMLEGLAEELAIRSEVSFPGFAANPFAYMAKARLFVLSSLFEGSPNVVVQALACGCPVVVTACPGMPTELRSDRRAGEIVPVGDPEALAAAMLRRLQEPRESYRPAWLERFEDVAVARRYLEVLFSPRRDHGNRSDFVAGLRGTECRRTKARTGGHVGPLR